MLIDRLKAKGPKRMLALDGGGIRGLITVGYLEKMEALLRERYGKPDLTLSDYFDLMGGTSTGSIIASALAIGKEVAEIKDMYLNLGGEIFSKKTALSSFGRALFDEEALVKQLEAFFGDITLGDQEKIKSGLCIITKRADTGSTWPFLNHPDSRYYKYNGPLLLRNVVRASTAAPVFFMPQQLEIGRGASGAFIDGGISMYNNPALQLFLVATVGGYHFNWETGEDNLLLVSLGTGSWGTNNPVEEVLKGTYITEWALAIPEMLMNDATWNNQMILQFLSNSPTAKEIDREVGTLDGELMTGEAMFTYQRYEVMLEKLELQRIGLADLADKAVDLRDMTAGENRDDLYRIGQEGARLEMKSEHFPAAFDINVE